MTILSPKIFSLCLKQIPYLNVYLVVFDDCTSRTSVLFHTDDSRFKVDGDGTLKLKRRVTLHREYKELLVSAFFFGKKFTVPVKVLHEAKHHHHLDMTAQPQPGDSVPVLEFPKSSAGLKRRKRDLVIPPINFPENDKGPFPKKVVQFWSCYHKEVMVTYSISGPGADQPPKGLFIVDRNRGNLFVSAPLDREKQDQYILFAHAQVSGSGQAEDPMEIILKVIDRNDNKPKFTKDPFTGEVSESLPSNEVFMTINATDADEPGNANSDIRYIILNQEPKLPDPNMFFINPVTGEIQVARAGLDREKTPKYTLDIQAADNVGDGLIATCKAIITVADSNDNAPQFTPPSYNASVSENQNDFEVVTMTATDGDDADTSAWATVYKIVGGDPDKAFSVSTGPSKLEGIVRTVKPLDFEKKSKYTLLVTVENEIPFVSLMPTSTATVIVTVLDVNEAPVFNPVVKTITKPEDLPIGTDLVAYTATDPDTARNQKVTYKIRKDDAGWFTINKDTGMIQVKSTLDRESLSVKDYETPATGTGTLIIQLEDVNDNAPVIYERTIRVCNRDPSEQFLSVSDADEAGNASPFSVSLNELTSANWTARMNAKRTGIILQLKKVLDSGDYNVVLRVSDNLGLSQDSIVQATVCDCTGDDVQCTDKAVAGVGLPGILGILGAVLLLLLLALLLLMFMRRRGGEKKEPLLAEDDVRDNIYYYDEEGGGEDDQVRRGTPQNHTRGFSQGSF
ncbi:hypothetical protein DPEC_G00346970 [Dallia pectoralis]|uniref:Uncharacterized protein n=1 Tax=Dallia pectoralis TaxID=75939 RepID=A0ACC2F3W5_DALPE|nr:hypothetical protein DPEC_G00346970 [Dallia pectoralis]